MKKILMMLLGVVFAACAWADVQAASWITPYSADTAPQNGNASLYSCYFLDMDAAKAATGGEVTTFSTEAYATWLQTNFAANMAATIANAQASTAYAQETAYIADFTQYGFTYMSPVFVSDKEYYAVCFFDNGSEQAFKVGECNKSKFYFDDLDDDCTEWTAPAAPLDPIEYLTWDESTKALVAATNAEYKVVTKDTATFENGKWYVVTNTIERGTITVNGAANLILCDGASLTVTGGDYVAGVEVAEGKSLAIYGQSEGTGALIATGGYAGAGIGGGQYASCGVITINGGAISATGGYDGAGIGGGSFGNGGTVTINGGTIIANGGEESTGSGIGGGMQGNGGAVTINGGTITAIGGNITARGIGGTEEGGTVTFGDGVNATITCAILGRPFEMTMEDYVAEHRDRDVKIVVEQDPLVKVSKLEAEDTPADLDVAYSFMTNKVDETLLGWNANFVVSFDKKVAKDSVTLKGAYDAEWSEGETHFDWQAWPMPDEILTEGVLAANTAWTLLPSDQVTYADILKIGEFKCGVRNNSSENTDAKMTVKLVLTDGTTTKEVSKTEYTLDEPSVPTAKVTTLEGTDIPDDVSAAYLFTTNFNNEVYADWNANFVVSFDNAVEKDSVTLKGAYEASWSSIVDTTWQELPMPKDLEADEEWTLLPETQVTYGDVIKFGEFKCGVRNNSADNEGTKMTVKLVLTKDNETITISTTEYTLESPLLPKATVTKLSGEAVPGDVDAAYLFTTNVNLEVYADWEANFVVTFDKDVKKDSVALKGEYTAPYGTYDWQAIDMPGDLKANTGWTLLPEGQVTYGDVLKFGEFKCGVRNNSSENVGTKMTVELVLTKDAESITISTTEYTLAQPTVPTATIKTLEGTDIPADVSAAYLFTTNHNNEVYADWNANFVVSFDNDVEKDSVTLKGEYEASWSSTTNTTWQAIEMPKGLDADEEWPLLPEGQVTYGDILNFGEFKCGVKNNSADNEGTKMTVKLVLTKDNETIIVSTTEYELEEVTLPEVTVKKLEGEEIPGDVEAAYTFTTNACVDTYLDWNANFVVSFDQAVEKDSVTLKGSYEASWSSTTNTTWQAIEMPKGLDADEEWTLLPEGQVTYADIVNIGTFKCGVRNNSFDNVGATMTVKLVLTKGERVKVLTETTYVLPEVTPPTATVEGLEGTDIPYDVDVAYTYKTNNYVEAYHDWYANFEVSFDQDVKKGSVAFKGEYSADWVNAGHKDYPWQDLTNFYDPFKDILGDTIPAGTVFNLVEEGNTTFGDLMKFVNGEFKCGVKNYSFDNEGTKMTVNLVLTDPEGNWDKRIIDTQTYTLPQITVHYASQEEFVKEGDYAYIRIYGGSKDHPVQTTLTCLKKSANSIANICLLPKNYPNYNKYKAAFTYPDIYVADSEFGEFKRADFPITLTWAKGDDSMKVIRIKTVKTSAKSANRNITLQLGHPVGATVQTGEDLCQITIHDNGENPPEEVTASVYPKHAGSVSGMGVLKSGKTRTLTASYAAFGKKAIYDGKKAQFVGWYKAQPGTTAIDFDAGIISEELKLKVSEPGHYIAYFVDVLPLPQVIASETRDEDDNIVDGVTGVEYGEAPALDGNGLMPVYTAVVGVNVTLPVKFVDLSDKGGKLTAKGLPAGLKLVYDKVTKTYSIKGKPTKATYYTAMPKSKPHSNYIVATLTGSNAAGKNVLKIGFVIAPVDGTFVGVVKDGETVIGGVTITIGKSGNSTAKITTLTDVVSLSAKELTLVQGENGDHICLRMTNKYGDELTANFECFGIDGEDTIQNGKVSLGSLGTFDLVAHGKVNRYNQKAKNEFTLSKDLYSDTTKVGTITFTMKDNDLATITAKVNGKSISGTGGYLMPFSHGKCDFFVRSGKLSLFASEVEFNYSPADSGYYFTDAPEVTFDNNGATTTLFIGHPID